MLSTSVIKNVGQASHYFSAKDNYYTKEEGHRQSEWYGNGANRLNLTGEVEAEQFTSLLEGKLPSGEQIGKVVDGELKHRAGWDLTFSAPKSVSILALIGGDNRLIEAHRKAVSVALAEVERSCSEARIKTRDGLVYQNTGNIIAALYHHDLSRAQDPQLHTHSVVMNITERQDGKWRSLASQIGRYDKETTSEVHGFIERVRNNKRYFGKVYEAELAYHVKELGYEIEVNEKTGVFEIVGVSKEARQFFSKRRNKIEDHMESNGLTGSKMADVVTLKTREAKKEIDRAVLAKEWDQDAKKLGFECQVVIDKSRDKLQVSSNEERSGKQLVNTDAIKAVLQAAKELSIFKTTFALEEVVTVACDTAVKGQINIESLLHAINSSIEQGDLISLANEKGKTVLMAKSTLEDEKKIIEHVHNSQALEQSIASYHLENYFYQHNEINSDTSESLKSIFGNDRFILLEGQATKEVLIKPIVDIAKSAQLSVTILSPNQITSKQLAEDVKIKPQTFWEHIKALFVDNNTIDNMSVTQFLVLKDNKKHDFLLIDNSHLLSAYQMSQLLEWGSTHETKMIFLGNKNVLTSQQVHVSLQHLIENGIKTISLKEKENTIAADISERNYQAVMGKVSGRIVEGSNYDDRLHAMANHYTKLHKEDRDQVA